MLNWVLDAGLSCTKGVWCDRKGFGIYMIGILGSLSDVVGGFSRFLLHVVYSSCNLLGNIKRS